MRGEKQYVIFAYRQPGHKAWLATFAHQLALKPEEDIDRIYQIITDICQLRSTFYDTGSAPK
jgi:hypothetical protein